MNNFFSVPTTVSTRDIQRNYTSIFNQVNTTNLPTLVISKNKPQVAIISLDAYNQYADYLAGKKFWTKIETLKKQNENVDQKKLQEEIDQTILAVRQKHDDQT